MKNILLLLISIIGSISAQVQLGQNILVSNFGREITLLIDEKRISKSTFRSLNTYELKDDIRVSLGDLVEPSEEENWVFHCLSGNGHRVVIGDWQMTKKKVEVNTYEYKASKRGQVEKGIEDKYSVDILGHGVFNITRW